MYILTPENKSFDTSRIPNETTTLYYCILDYTDPEDVDYKFAPMVFIEDFARAAAELKIGDFRIQVPLHWCVLLGDRDFGDLEIMPITSLNGRDFCVFTYNPCIGYMPSFLPIDIVNIYQEVRWTVPTIKPEHMLCIPLADGENPLCAFFVDPKNKLPDILDIRQMF